MSCAGPSATVMPRLDPVATSGASQELATVAIVLGLKTTKTRVTSDAHSFSSCNHLGPNEIFESGETSNVAPWVSHRPHKALAFGIRHDNENYRRVGGFILHCRYDRRRCCKDGVRF